MKRLTIMRGLPSSGKSTKAKELGGYICSADDFFVKDGVYTFDPKLISEAHAACRAKAMGAMALDVPHIIIDNTNTQKWEYEKYIRMANDFGYEVVIVDCGAGSCSFEELAERNVHRVPIETIKKMAARWEP